MRYSIIFWFNYPFTFMINKTEFIVFVSHAQSIVKLWVLMSSCTTKCPINNKIYCLFSFFVDKKVFRFSRVDHNTYSFRKPGGFTSNSSVNSRNNLISKMIQKPNSDTVNNRIHTFICIMDRDIVTPFFCK